jgi:large subunit ribosomal protein L3
VDVIGITKGKGSKASCAASVSRAVLRVHGSMFHRRIGSIGMRQTPGRSWKNQAMPGHMGGDRRTVQNLRVVKVLPEKNLAARRRVPFPAPTGTT